MKSVLVSVLLLIHSLSFASEPEIILLKPTGVEIDGLAEMEIYSDNTQVAIRMNEIIEGSVIKEFLEIHKILQTYLFKTTGKPIEPAYLALTENQGGYAIKGFVIKENGEHIEKINSYYVDINKRYLEGSYEKIMSITQLYPHELGHIMYRLLSSSDVSEENSRNVNIHFFSLVTDYQIAFNEGYAEHLENIARLYETNKEVIDGINKDTLDIVKNSKVTIKGFKKDFEQPWRIGYYKMSMLLWYNRFEDYKRFSYPLDGRSKYTNSSISSSNEQNNLIYRNSGVSYNSNKIRNKVQLMASEGTVSTFFSLLSQTKAKNVYRDEAFYKLFQLEESSLDTPQNTFTPLQNLFVKQFYILHNYVNVSQSDKAQLIDFIEGYLKEFPEEESIIKETYKITTGEEYENSLPPPLWLLIRNIDHGILAMDAYAGLTIPVYTFDINAAEKEDLMMIDEVSEEDAKALLKYREKNGLFVDLNKINSIEGMSKTSKKAILSSVFDNDYFNAVEFPEDLNINSVITAPIKRLVLYGLLLFIIVMSIYFTLLYKEKLTTKKVIIPIIKYIFLWILFLLSGLIIAALGLPWVMLLICTALALLFSLFYKGIKKRRSVYMIIMMTLIILVSLL